MANWQHEKNDGWNDVDYDFGLEEADAKKLSSVINEACHVYKLHPDGHWNKTYKDKYSNMIREFFRNEPKLSSRLLRSDDRIIKMLTYRALELEKTLDPSLRWEQDFK